MPLTAQSRRDQSARHYLLDGALSSRLRPTVLLAARALEFPIAMVNILDADTQHTIGQAGTLGLSSMPRSESISDAVVRSGDVVVVQDARADPRFADLPLVVSGKVGSYLGVPLSGRESMVVGVLCVVDRETRSIDDDQIARLAEFGKVVEDQLDLVRRLKEQRQGGKLATAELARAIRAGEIVPWYQPVVDMVTGVVAGFEALARWQHPSGPVDEPNSFVPLAEDSDLIIELDHVVMRQAFTDLSRWQRARPKLRMSTNLSGRQFDQTDWITPIVAAVEDAGVPAESVNLELTETARLPPGYADGPFVKLLQHRGFQVWLDDFGTGWSSMEYLLLLPANGIKIDRMISVALGTHVGDVLARSVNSMAHQLGMKTTIEGIENAEQAALAMKLGCDYGQGFLWSAPVPASGVDEAWLDHRWEQSSVVPNRPLSPTLLRRVDGSQLRTADGSLLRRGDSTTPLPEGKIPESGTDFASDVLNAIPDATAVLDQDGVIVAVNRAWREFSVQNGGTPAGNGVGVSYVEVCERAARSGNEDARQVLAGIHSVLTGKLTDVEMEYACPSPGMGRWFVLRIARLAGRSQGAVMSHVNITRRKLAEDRVAYAASHDPLSGLANRTLLHDRMVAALTPRSGGRQSWGVGVIYIDLDDFKAVNDTYGHFAGDEVLLAVAHRLLMLVRPGDTVGRLGGDEFAVLVAHADLTGVTKIGRRIEKSLAEPHFIQGHPVVVPGSVGVRLAVPGDTPEDALMQADRAMYDSKLLRSRQV